MKLDGRELLVLQACRDLPKDQYDNVHDDEIARETRLPLPDVKAVLESLDGRELVSKVRLSDDHYAAQITSNGILELSQRSPLPDGSKKNRIQAIPIKIVPKGLRSFDDHDADFFLDLLPGPRRANGLPESIHFWKVRIEEMDPDKTFSVGVIYGPSGCGKSSLVKAGMLPRLADSVIRIYVEATANDTEARLLRELRKHVPNLPTDLALPEGVRALQEGQFDQRSKKVLIVIDQFEQWLHAKRLAEATELVQALGHCDGRKVQAIVMVRVDFWMALTRFMGKLGIELHQGQNFVAVDLFDQDHARKVLTLFGQAFGRVSDTLDNLTEEQRAFLDQASAGLALEDGKVVSVRLALFAEMVKGRPWTPTTLRTVGGMEGVGVSFLEQTFSSPQGNPRHRLHQKAAQAVLKALLPEGGAGIKGNMMSQQTLLEASGYSPRPRDFDDLLRILDNEVRLITPTEPEGTTDKERQDQPSSGERYYQLTHDYLVPSIQDWLTRKQKETRRGRAELLLAERASLWNAKPENRHLPSLLEWTNIGLLTKKKDWTEPQRKIMRRAGRVYELRGLGLAVLIALVSWGGMEGYGRLRASDLVESLQRVGTPDVPAIVKQLSDYRRWADPQLVRVAQGTDAQSRQHLHASLALFPVDASQVDYLFNRLLSAKENGLPVLRDALKTHQSTLTPKLWTVLETAKPGDAGLLPAASALASYDPEDARWKSAGGKVAETLVSVNSLVLGPWVEALRPVSGKLTVPLAMIFRDKSRSGSVHSLATDILTNYSNDDPNLIANLLMDADFKAYAAFFPIAQRQEAKTLPLFQAEISKKATYSWDDPPLDPSWTTPDATLTGKIESAQGMLAERFAFCQTMPLDEFLTTAEALRPSGYRPIRFRPYANGKNVLVAAVWVRDSRPWRLAHDQSTDEIQQADEQNRKAGFLPLEVAGYLAAGGDEGKPTSRFAALWAQRLRPDDDARMALASSAVELTKLQEQLKNAGLVPLTLHTWRQEDDKLSYSGVWYKTTTRTSDTASFQNGLSEADLPGVLVQQAGSLIDLDLTAAPPPPSTKERAASVLQAAEAALKAKPNDRQARLDQALAHLQLGESQKAIDDLDAVIKKSPQTEAYQYRAIAQARLGHKDQAKADLEKFEIENESESQKLCLAVIVAAELGEGTDQAFERLEADLKNQPQDSELHYDAACTYAPGLTHHNSESGLAGKPCLLVKSKLLDHIVATFR